MEYYNVEHPRELVHCHFCQRDITRRIYITCEQCNSMQICIECFANGSENENHHRTHNYRVFSKLDIVLLENDWKGYEELILLSGLETVGYGNWAEIRSMLGNQRTAEEVELHFRRCYEAFIGERKTIEERRAIIAKEKRHDNIPTLLAQKLRDMAPLIEQARERAIRFGITMDKGAIGDKNASVFGDVLGYMPLREEFDTEYDNDFELYLAEMEFTDEDTPEEVATKYNILEIYTKVLVEREKRKKFVIEHGLLDLRAQMQLEKRLSPVERQIRNTLKPFMRFMSQTEFEELVADLIREGELRQSLEVMLAAQQLDIRSLEDLENLVFQDENALSIEKRLAEFNQTQQTPEPASLLQVRLRRPKPATVELNNLTMPDDEHQVFRDSGNFIYNQRQFCEKLGINFKEFLLIKEYLVRLAVSQGVVDRKESAKAVNVDPARFNKIFDFLVENNVIIEDNYSDK